MGGLRGKKSAYPLRFRRAVSPPSSIAMHALVQWVSSFVGNTSASRGLEYYQMGSVIIESESSHQGSKPEELAHVVRGIIQGTSPTPYQAWVSFTDSAISDGHCSCPVGGNGTHCHLLPFFLSLLQPFTVCFLGSLCC